MLWCQSPSCVGAPSYASVRDGHDLEAVWSIWLCLSSTYFGTSPDLAFESGWRELPDLAPVSDAACSGRRLHERLMDVSGLFYRAY